MKYWIDTEDRIVRIDEDWPIFAQENGASELTFQAVEGRPLRKFISDKATAHLWTLLLNKARKGYTLDLDIRCDAPDCRRLVHLNLSRDADRLCCTATVIQKESRPFVSLLDPKNPCSNDVVVCCSWCKKFQVQAARWLEVEEAIDELQLFQCPKLPGLTHGACPTCYSTVLAEI